MAYVHNCQKMCIDQQDSLGIQIHMNSVVNLNHSTTSINSLFMFT